MSRISALNTGIFQLWKQASVQKAPVSYLLMPHRTHFNVTPDKLSAPFISNNNSRKVLPFCWHRTELVRMLQKPLVRNSLHLPYWHNCINWVQAAKSLCRKFCPPPLLSLHSHLFFQEYVEYSLQTAVAATEAVTDSTSLPDGRNLLHTLCSSCWKPSLSQFSPRANQFLALNKER